MFEHRRNPFCSCPTHTHRSEGPALKELNSHYGPLGVRAVKDVHAIFLVGAYACVVCVLVCVVCVDVCSCRFWCTCVQCQRRACHLPGGVHMQMYCVRVLMSVCWHILLVQAGDEVRMKRIARAIGVVRCCSVNFESYNLLPLN